MVSRSEIADIEKNLCRSDQTSSMIPHDREKISRERELTHLKYVFESTEIDVQITQHSIQTLLEHLKGNSEIEGVFEGFDPRIAMKRLEQRLVQLLQQRDTLRLQITARQDL